VEKSTELENPSRWEIHRVGKSIEVGKFIELENLAAADQPTA
jgi:hypothetical protein